MNRTRVRRRRITLTVASALLLTVVIGPVGHALQADASVRRPDIVVVRQGDTLWAIAARTSPTSDPRTVVDGIAAANQIDAGALVPGQRLVLPSP